MDFLWLGLATTIGVWIGAIISSTKTIETSAGKPTPNRRTGEVEGLGFEISSIELSRDDIFAAMQVYCEREGHSPEHDKRFLQINIEDGFFRGGRVTYYRNTRIAREHLWLAKG